MAYQHKLSAKTSQTKIHLVANEIILWEGLPSLRAPRTLKDIFFRISAFIVGVIASIWAILWWLDLTSAGALYLKIMLTGFAISGFVSAFAPRLWLHRKTLALDRYVVTNKRAFIVRTAGDKAKYGLKNQILHSWPLDRSIWPQKTENSILFEFIDKGVDNLINWQSNSDSGFNTGFVLLENADIPYKIIREVLDR
jgi:hypothetical protein